MAQLGRLPDEFDVWEPAMPEIGLFDATYSARALRRLKPDPVPQEIITRILDAAVRAPSAGNAQNWAFIVVRDAEQRRRLGMIYRKASDIASEVYKTRGRPPHMSDEQFRRFLTSGAHLWDHMGDAPVLLVPCLHDRPPPPREALPPSVQAIYAGELAYEQRIRGASIYPAVQNIILACRAFGLGTVITTNHIRCEEEVKELLRLPSDVSTYALMPIGYPQGKFGPLARRPVAEVACADRWGAPWPS
jgi:nitroreductase